MALALVLAPGRPQHNSHRRSAQFRDAGCGAAGRCGEPAPRIPAPAAEWAGERRLHPAAAVVAAEHHPLHLKVVEGILQDAHDVVVGGIEHVGDIAVDKELAGLAAGEHLGGHAAVGAADPQRVGPLPVDPFSK